MRMQPGEYTVGWICAVGIELVVAYGVLDEHYAKEKEPWIDTSRDHNSYTFGCIHGHNVVITALPLGRYGIATAAVVARDMQTSFPNLQIRLTVGIAGGAPSKKNDIRLGDVVVSSPTSGYGGVFQYDFGKATQGYGFQATGYLAPPPQDLLNGIAHLKAQHQTGRHRIAKIIENMLDKIPELKNICSRPAPDLDRLYPAHYSHSVYGRCSCLINPLQKIHQPPISRKKRTDSEDDPMIHYGLVASANSVMKDAITRDILIERHDMLCFEMEAAGLMNTFPCLVIRGICDYSDSHKNDVWQGYAAATAAAYAKELLSILYVRQSQLSLQYIQHPSKAAPGMNLEDVQLDKEDRECLQKLHLTAPDLDKARIEKRAGSLFRDCYKWILDHDAYRRWMEDGQLLWVKGDPGKGKTMLLCGIIDELDKLNLTSMSYFFCQATYGKTNNNATAVLRGLVWMLAKKNPRLVQHIRVEADSSSTDIYTNGNSFFVLCKILRSMLQNINKPVLIVDALDECEEGRDDLIDLIKETSRSCQVKWLISSRNWPSIEERLGDAPRLSLEIEKSVGDAVKSYISYKVSQLSERKGFKEELTTFISDYLMLHAQGTFLWAALVCTSLDNTANKRTAEELVKKLPPTLDALYKRMLDYVLLDSNESKKLSSILAAAIHVHRPLNIEELSNVIELSDADRESVHELIQECGSFLTIRDGIIEFVHQSAQEYIKVHLPRAIETKSMHLELYKCSLRTLSTTLKRNIYEVEDTASNVTDIKSLNPNSDPLASITYCCLYWAEHLEQSGDLANELREGSCLSIFLHQHYLFWLEAIALLKSIPQAVHLMHLLHNTTKDCVKGALTDLVHDAYCYIKYFRIMIETYPLQIYDSGLVFCPTNSLIKQIYTPLTPKWVSMVVAPVHDWPTHTAFNIHERDRIAVGAEQGSIDVYDVTTGSLLHSVLGDRSRCILELAFIEADSKLIFTFENSSSATILATWDLYSTQITELRDFPCGSKLSPNGKHIIYTEDDGGRNSLHCYQVDTGRTFSLSSATDSAVGFYSFSVDGSGIALWWSVGPIEVWEILDKTKCGSIQYPVVSPRRGNMALSQRNEILAFQSDRESLKSITMVFDVKSGHLIWQSPSAECSINPWFLRETPILCIPNKFDILLYNARSGTEVDRFNETIRESTLVSTFKHRIAVIKDFKIKLVDTRIKRHLPMSLTHGGNVHQIHGDQPMANLQDKPRRLKCKHFFRTVKWTTSRNINMTAILWTTGPPTVDLDQGPCTTQRNKPIVALRENDMAILVTRRISKSDSLREQATFTWSCGCKFTYSPDRMKVIYFDRKEQRFSVLDDRTQTMSTAISTVVSDNDEIIESTDSVHTIRILDKTIRIWPHTDGLQNLNLETGPEFKSLRDFRSYSISPSGMLLAGIAYEDKLSCDSDNSSLSTEFIVRIWNLKNGSRSKFVLRNDKPGKLSCLSFLPCETRVVLLFNRSIQIWSVSGTLLYRKDDNFLAAQVTLCEAFSSRQLYTSCGVITIEKEIRLGTANEPYMTRNWVWHNGQRILWIPPAYCVHPPKYSVGRLAMSHGSHRPAALKFFFSQME